MLAFGGFGDSVDEDVTNEEHELLSNINYCF
jgi:hypothetical protein